MALKKCKECGKEVSTEAKACPNCGAPGKSKNSVGCLTIIAIIFVIGMIVYLIDHNKYDKTSKTQSDASKSQVVVQEEEKKQVDFIKESKARKSPTKSRESTKGVELRQDQIDLLIDLQNKGLIMLEPKLNTVYIETGLWESMNIKLKEDFAATLATYCANKKGSDAYWVEIYDKYSGKKLAKFGVFGLKVY